MDDKLKEEIHKIAEESGIIEVPCNTYMFMSDEDIDLEQFRKNINKLFIKSSGLTVDIPEDRVTHYCKNVSLDFLIYFKDDISKHSWSQIFFARDFDDTIIDILKDNLDMNQVFNRKINRNEINREFIEKYKPILNFSSIIGAFEKLPNNVREELYYEHLKNDTCIVMDILRYIGEIK
jgi:hypothetical protein